MLLGAAMLLALCSAVIFPSVSRAQVTTWNPFVGAAVDGSNGLVVIYKGPPGNHELLSYIDRSFLTVKVNNLVYSNNDNVPVGSGIDVMLAGGVPKKIRDTVQTIWKENGFDIVQNVYPVQFTNSGVIVISIKIVNHSGLVLNSQAQFLLDNMNSNNGPPADGNDNPYLIHRYGAIRNWQDCPPNPIPSFYLAFEYPPTDPKLGTVGIGYDNDTFPPRPLGLIPLTTLQFGYWGDQIYYPWGIAPHGNTFTDAATLLIAPQMQAGGNDSPDSVTEIFRTAYGTPEWCYDRDSNMFGFALYPHHIYWDGYSYTPNPFQVEAYLYNLRPSATNATTIRQTVGNPIVITSPAHGGLPGSQLQNVGSIQGDGFHEVDWTDSATILQTGCPASFPVDIHFDVIAGGNDTLLFPPWDCDLTVDCPNPDTLPPTFQNSFAGCDSLMHDTITVQDNQPFDLGIDTITYSSPDLDSAQYLVTFKPLPPFKCTNNPVKIYVQQVDTFQSGHVIFTFTDCANNVSHDTICFTAHPPLPDRTAPVFFDSTPADCHAQCTDWNVTDTQKSATSIDRGVDSIVVVSDTNMTLSGGGKYPPGTPEVTIRVCVTDSMHDGTIVLRATDTARNFSFDTIHYCTTPDTLPPIIIDTGFDPADSSYHVHISETRPWDRGIDSVWIEQASNVTTVPVLPVSLTCLPTFDVRVIVLDTAQCASAQIFSKDCFGNISGPYPISFPKGAIPVIVASKTLLCSTADSAVLDAGVGYSGYLWSNGDTTQRITVGQGSYYVTVQEGEGCPATSKPDTITLSPATPNIVPAGPITLCAPDSAQLDAGAGFATYQWLKDGADMPGVTSEKIWVSSSGAYSVQVTNAAGCSGTSPAVTVTINPLPARPIITAVNNVMTATDASPVVSYQWYQNGTILPGATSQTYTDTSGSYTVMVTDANGCSNTSLPFSNSGSTLITLESGVAESQGNQVSIPLSVATSLGAPTGNLGYTAKIAFNKTLLIPAPGSFTSMSVKGGSLIVTYNGTGAANPPGVLQNLNFTAALGDDSCTPVTIDSFAWNVPNITVTVQNGSFCLTGLCYQGGPRLINPTGTVTLSAAQPNPAHTSIEIGYSLIEQGYTTLILYDVLGHEVLRLVDADLQPGTYTVDADVSTLPPGTYIYSLRTPTIVKSAHLQIAR